MTLTNPNRIVLVLITVFSLISIPTYASDHEKILNNKGEILSIVHVDYPQFQPYKVRTESAKKAAEDYGIKYTMIQPSKVSTEAYIDAIANVINQGFDAIIAEPWDYDAFRPVLEQAKEKGIPMVSVHQDYPDPSLFISMLYVNNAGYGVSAADELGRSTGGKANVLLMMNNASIPNQAIMRQSFLDAIAKSWPGIKVVDTQFTNVDSMTASKVLEAALKAYPEIDTAIWLEGATVTTGIDVVKEMGLIKKVKVIGIDDPPDVITSIGKGEAWGSFNQNFQKQGYEAVRHIVDHYRKKPFPKKTDVGIVLITKDNWDNYLPDMWKPVAVKGKSYSN